MAEARHEDEERALEQPGALEVCGVRVRTRTHTHLPACRKTHAGLSSSCVWRYSMQMHSLPQILSCVLPSAVSPRRADLDDKRDVSPC